MCRAMSATRPMCGAASKRPARPSARSRASFMPPVSIATPSSATSRPRKRPWCCAPRRSASRSSTRRRRTSRSSSSSPFPRSPASPAMSGSAITPSPMPISTPSSRRAPNFRRGESDPAGVCPSTGRCGRTAGCSSIRNWRRSRRAGCRRWRRRRASGSSRRRSPAGNPR